MTYPHLGSVVRQAAGSGRQSAARLHPHHARGNGGVSEADAAFLGPRYASVALGDGKAPANINRPADLTAEADKVRHDIRLHASERFLRKRRTAETEAYTQTYDQAAQLMKQKRAVRHRA